jgi:hypothetical protein
MSLTIKHPKTLVRFLVAAITAMASLTLVPASEAQTNVRMGSTSNGVLARGDRTLDSGEFYDDFTVQLREGQSVRIEMTSTEVDPYLIVSGPGQLREENDDVREGNSNAAVEFTATRNGMYTIRATTFEPGEIGRYSLRVMAGTGGSTPRPPQQQAGGGGTPASGGGGASTPLQINSVINGTFAPGDQTLDKGEFMDTYSLQVQAGREYSITLSSSAVDSYLIVRGPGGLSVDNDDDDTLRGSRDARATFTPTQSGTVSIGATTFDGNERGAYVLRVNPPANQSSRPAAQQIASGQISPITLGRPVNGALARGDTALSDGQFVDSYAFQGTAGQRVDIRLTSTTLDTMLAVSGPNNFGQANDDEEGANSSTNSRLQVTLPAAGRYIISASSYEAAQTGNYTLSIAAGSGSSGSQTTAAAGRAITPGQAVNATLARGSGNTPTRDVYRISATAGQSVRIEMDSAAFDTNVSMVSPSGQREQNDDSPRGGTNSLLETTFAESGTYTIEASAFGANMSGAYRLLVSLGEGGGRQVASNGGQQTPTPPRPSSGNTLTPGGSLSGALARGDTTLEAGEYYDQYVFEGRRGQTVTIDMTSTAVDSYLVVFAPNREQKDNDDASDGQRDSRLTWTLPADGRYTVYATSYAAAEAGTYSLRFNVGGAGQTPNRPNAGAGRVYGVFVGISDYPGANNDLDYTAEDAIKLRDTLQREGVLGQGSVLLTDAQATVANVRNAIRQVGQLAGPNDTFIVFYSGHGIQVDQEGGTAQEADGKDEAIALYDDLLIDDEMAQLMSGLRAKVSLLTLDACFSGGFARDVVSRPGIMGLFSSEEDLTSAVASKFEAGGYLSHYLRTGMAGEADQNNDRIVTAGELSAYLRREFAEGAAGVDAETIDGQSNYQFLVVERGGVKIDDPLVAIPSA